jgi:hypothetical protein
VYDSKSISQECAKAYLSELVSITDNRAYTLLAFVPGGVECAKAYLSELVSITDNRAYTLLAFVPGGVDPFRPTVI